MDTDWGATHAEPGWAASTLRLTEDNVEVLDAALDNQARVGRLYDALAQLSGSEYTVVVLRYGLYDDECYTYEAIGHKLGILPYSVQRIEQRALEKLKRKLDSAYAIAAGWRELAKRLLDLKASQAALKRWVEAGTEGNIAGGSDEQPAETADWNSQEQGALEPLGDGWWEAQLPEVPSRLAS